jgi:hypothetical protein
MQAPLATTAAAIMGSPRTAHIIWEMTLDLTDEKAALLMLMLLRQTVERSPESLRLRARAVPKSWGRIDEPSRIPLNDRGTVRSFGRHPLPSRRRRRYWR